MLMTKAKRTPIRTLRGWAAAVLQETGAIRECEYHGWMQDRADPHARERAFELARQNPPHGLSPEAAAVAITEVLDSIGDTCPNARPRSRRWRLGTGASEDGLTLAPGQLITDIV